jgi:hypothetical protein
MDWPGDARVLVQVLEVRTADLGGEDLRVARDRDDVRVLRYAPEPAAARPVVPVHGRLAAKERERLVRHALGEDVVLEIDPVERQRRPSHA